MANFVARRNIPSLRGKVILVTGGSTGLGRQCVQELAFHKPAEIWLTARSTTVAKNVAQQVQHEVLGARVIPLGMDLASFSSIRAAATTFLANAQRLDVLMLNAGVMTNATGLTEEGYETHFGVNHVGHALLTKLLLPKLLESASTPPAEASAARDARVVVVTSDLMKNAPAEMNLVAHAKSTCEDMSAIQRYGQSKLASALYARSLAARFPQLTIAAVHPGVTATSLLTGFTETSPYLRWLSPVMRAVMAGPETGARNQLWAATSADVKSGELYYPVGVLGRGSQRARDDKLAEELWAWTESELMRNDIGVGSGQGSAASKLGA